MDKNLHDPTELSDLTFSCGEIHDHTLHNNFFFAPSNILLIYKPSATGVNVYAKLFMSCSTARVTY